MTAAPTFAGDVSAHLKEREREVQWEIEVSRTPEGAWAVERRVDLYPIEQSELEHELPPITCRDSVELTRQLPQLVAELLTTPSRELPTPSDPRPT
jgi:hypothetical protein